MTCAGCGSALAEGEALRVPRALAWLASFALAMAHGGMWAKAELAKPYCARCRRNMALFALLLAAFMAALGGIGLRLWLTMPEMPK